MTSRLVVVWTTFPAPSRSHDPVADTAGTVVARRDLGQLADELAARRRRWWRRGAADAIGAELPVDLTRTPAVADADLDRLPGLVRRLGADTQLLLVVTPGELYAEDLWRRSVWDGAAMSREDAASMVDARLTDVRARLERLAADQPRVRLVPLAVDSSAPAWKGQHWQQLSQRAVAILGRLNGHAEDDHEREQMREFCVSRIGTAP